MQYTNIGLTILLWSGYFTVHSLLASNKVKSSLKTISDLSDQSYRIIYNLIAISGLIGIFYFLASTPSVFIFEESESLKYISLALSTWGIIVIKRAFASFSLKEFLGIRKGVSQDNFYKTGILGHIRHPIYAGTILLIIGFWLFIPNILNLISVGCVIGYILVGMRLEESKLVNQFGNEYLEYKENVPAIIPRFGKSS